jgi:hypothetical protein
VDMCKGKRKYDHEALMTSSLSDCTWLEKEWKIRLSTTWHPSLHFFFHLIHPSHIFLATPLLSFYSFLSLSHTHLFIFLYFSIFSFFLFHTHTFLFIFPSLDIFSKLSTPLYLACTQSEILNKPY